MNGALHANINAVLAHIRNGNLNGPVGLLAGLAIADSAAATAQAKAIALANLADAHDALSAGLSELGFDSVSEYLAAVEAGDVKEADIARVSGLIDAAGGLNPDGTELATTRPTDEELTAAETAVAEGRTGVREAEQAIIDAWNKEGDEATLLASLRERLVGNEAEIAAAIADAEARAEATETAETDQSEDPADL
ncbi:hypothetical protein ACSBLW_13355 [Thioclava sp. FR2]|uniref:hypothetical protein n=1 Tax=Thioclava sp. FR2 TaxID=3445780 RepID=UPI003EBDCC8A